MVKGEKVVKDVKVAELKAPMGCIGNICFNADGTITVKVPPDAPVECAKATADRILSGKQVKFEIEPREESKEGEK